MNHQNMFTTRYNYMNVELYILGITNMRTYYYVGICMCIYIYIYAYVVCICDWGIVGCTT